jgi:electron transport complex protein RnfD
LDNKRYIVTSTPHVRSKDSIESVMHDVLIGLAPAALAGIYFFGLRALAIMILGVGACILFEFLYERVMKKPITIRDCSAAVTGLLLAFNLPASSPFWMPIVGSFVAIVIVKQLFGGLGQNFVNPALAARAFLMAAYTPLMAGNFTKPVDNPLSVDLVSAATPLTQMKENAGFAVQASDFFNALFGNVGGVIGETCAVALIIGGIYLLVRKVITWHIPVAYIVTVFIVSTILGRNGFFNGNGLYEIVTGGLMLGAFFMATDYTTSPVAPIGKIIFGIGCGILTVVIRNYGGYPEGVSYSILLMNLVVPYINDLTRRKPYGGVAK